MTLQSHSRRTCPWFRYPLRARNIKLAWQIQQEMSKRGLDLLILNDVANQHYITAYDGWSFYTPQMVLVPAAGEPVWIGRAMDAAGGRLTAWMKPKISWDFRKTMFSSPTVIPWTGSVNGSSPKAGAAAASKSS